MPTNTRLEDNSWENAQTNLLTKSRDSRQVCKKLRNLYEARVFLENDYGQRMLQLAKTMDPADLECGAVGVSLFTMQKELVKTANYHLDLAKDIKERATDPLDRVLEMQTRFRRDLETNIKNGLYHKLKLMVEYVLNASERYNTELEETDKRPHTYTRDGKPIYKASEKRKLDTLLGNYENAMSELKSVVADWNTKWHLICKEFENLEKERVTLFKSNLTQYADLFSGTLELERDSCNLVSHTAEKIDIDRYLDEFVTSQLVTSKDPTAMDYIRLHAYQIQQRNSPDKDNTKSPKAIPAPQKQTQPPSPVPSQSERTQSSSEVARPADEQASTFVISRVKIYGSDDEDEDEVDGGVEDDYYVVDGSQDVYSVEGESMHSQPYAEDQSTKASDPLMGVHSSRMHDPVVEVQDFSEKDDSLHSYQKSGEYRQANQISNTHSNPVSLVKEERERGMAFSERKPVASNRPPKQTSDTKDSDSYKMSDNSSNIPSYEAQLPTNKHSRPGFPLYDDPTPTGSKLTENTEYVQEELDDMLRELQHQDHKGALSRSSSRIRVSGLRPQKSTSSRVQKLQRDDTMSSSTASIENDTQLADSATLYNDSRVPAVAAPGGKMTFREKLLGDRRISAREAQNVMQKQTSDKLLKKDAKPIVDRVDPFEKRSTTPTRGNKDYQPRVDSYEKRSVTPTRIQDEYEPSVDRYEKRSVTPAQILDDYEPGADRFEKRNVTPTPILDDYESSFEKRNTASERIYDDYDPSIDRLEKRSPTITTGILDDYEPAVDRFEKRSTTSTRILDDYEPGIDRFEKRGAAPPQIQDDYEPGANHFGIKKGIAPTEQKYIDKVTTLYSYVADDDGELSFEDGEILQISEKREGGWWLAHDPHDSSRQGLIPSNFVESVV